MPESTLESMTELTLESTIATRFVCRHIFADGRRCGSPALREEQFCYYHHNTRGAAARAAARNATNAGFNLPIPEDREGIQQSLHQIIQRLTTNELDPRRASLILYGLQIAAQTIDKRPVIKANLPLPVEEVTFDTQLGDMAPCKEFKGRPRLI